MGEPAKTDAEVASALKGLQMVERVREALEDRFDVEVREAVVSGMELPVERLHDYLTGVADGHEPRVRLLFELHDRGALDLGGVLADVAETCFFLGDTARYHRPLQDWLDLFDAPCRHDDLSDRDLWSAGDLVWGLSRSRAEDSAAFLSLSLDRPVGVWRARARGRDLRVVAIDRWSGRDAGRVVVPPGLLEVEQVADGEPLPLDVALIPRPRLVDEL